MFCFVSRGQWHGPVAIKKIPINPALDLDAQLLAFKQEIATLKKTRHDNIVLFMGACMKPPELAIVTRSVMIICYLCNVYEIESVVCLNV